MDLKEKIMASGWVSGKKHVSVWLILGLGALGVLLAAAAIWVAVTDWRSAARQQAAAEQAGAAVALLDAPLQSLRRVLSDEQVQTLAARALSNPETVGDLFAYVNGRMGEIRSVRVFPADLSGVRPEDLGPGGYALFDMLLTVREGGRGALQYHPVAEPPAMVDAVPVGGEDEPLGVLVANIDPDYLLSAFQPAFDELGYIRLAQFNGSQRSTTLREFGDAALMSEVPDRLSVPGTLLRVEMPRQGHVEIAAGRTLVMLFLAGLLCVAAAFVFHRSNARWALEQRINEARRKRALGDEPEALEAPARVEPVERPAAPSAAAPVPDRPARTASAAPEPPPPLRLKYNIPERRKLRESEHAPVELTPEIFRAYDIRGVIDKTLDSGVARQVGQVIGTLALEKNAGPMVVARDGRLSGPYLMEGMIEGILASGCDVLDIGAVPTGVLYFAAHELAAGSGVMITGSHNPPDYNGFKIMIGGDPLHGEAISGLYNRIQSGRMREGEGQVTQRNVVPDYIEKIASDIQVERPLKVVIDCGNGIGGVCAADTLRAIGVEVIPLFDEVDGTFPNHHPDPSEPENLKDLIESVRLMDADLGLALDGDADRLGVVTLAGNIIYPDRVMMLLALDVLDRVPGATIIYDVKCTGHLPKVIREAGGEPVMYKTGHSLIKARMKEIGSPFAGEMSGHFFFGERWYGVDDGIYSAARLLEILGGTEAPPEAILNALPSSFSTPELKVQMQEGENHAFIEAFRAAARFEGAKISTIDGLRADFPDGWGLVRASNTTPILVVRFDADTEEALKRIKTTFRSQMLALRGDLELPF